MARSLASCNPEEARVTRWRKRHLPHQVADEVIEAQLPLLKPSREERMAQMDEDILDVGGAARVLGVSTRTIYWSN